MKPTRRGGLCVSMACFFLLFWLSRADASPSAGLDGSAVCNGSIAECSVEEEELVMDSEIHRRMLQGGGRYINYRALNPNRPVCNRGPGNSYTGSCLPQRSNPRTRPCNAYYRCRS
uniref:Keratin, type I cytoskeletal 24 n=1 Tax=Anthurium amnicola TaxID=1678845 RepID=A0A1D1XFL6_9ARAE